MNNIFQKINKKYLIGYGFSFLSALYITYLIVHLNSYNIVSTVTIGLFLTILFEIFTCYSIKNFKFNSFEKKKKGIIVSLTSLLSLVFFLLGFKFFTHTYQDAKVIIEPNENKQIISSIVIDNVVYDYSEDNNFYNDYSYAKSSIINYQFVDDYYILNVKKAYNIIINFNSELKNATVIDGNKVVSIPEYGTIYSYHVTSNSIFSSASYVRCVFSFLILFVGIFHIMNLLFSNIKHKCLLITILGTFSIGLFYFLNSQLSYLYNDSESYIFFNFDDFLHLKFSNRTPIYPLVIRLCSILFAEHKLNFVCLFQYICWGISIIYLYKLFNLFIKNEKCCSAVALIYALSPTIVGWNNLILTESIALSGTVIFAYFIIHYLKTDCVKSAIIASIIAFILTFHRPTFLMFVMFIEIFLIFRFIFAKDKIKKDFKCFICNTISIFLIGIYAIIFHRTFGIYSISTALVWQDLFVNVQEGYYKSSDNLEFIEKVDIALQENPDVWTVTPKIVPQFTLAEIARINRDCRMKNLDKYVAYIVRLTKQYAIAAFRGYSFQTQDINYDWLYSGLESLLSILTFGHVYVFFAIEFLMTIVLWIKNKKIPWVHLGLFAFPCAIVYSSFIGTCAEFMRTAICCIPFTYISICLMLMNVFEWKDCTNSL